MRENKDVNGGRVLDCNAMGNNSERRGIVKPSEIGCNFNLANARQRNGKEILFWLGEVEFALKCCFVFHALVVLNSSVEGFIFQQ